MPVCQFLVCVGVGPVTARQTRGSREDGQDATAAQVGPFPRHAGTSPEGLHVTCHHGDDSAASLSSHLYRARSSH